MYQLGTSSVAACGVGIEVVIVLTMFEDFFQKAVAVVDFALQFGNRLLGLLKIELQSLDLGLQFSLALVAEGTDSRRGLPNRWWS